MTDEQFRAALDAIGWGTNECALQSDVAPRQVRRWFSGADPVPQRIADWLADLAAYHLAHPAPERPAPPG